MRYLLLEKGDNPVTNRGDRYFILVTSWNFFMGKGSVWGFINVEFFWLDLLKLRVNPGYLLNGLFLVFFCRNPIGSRQGNDTVLNSLSFVSVLRQIKSDVRNIEVDDPPTRKFCLTDEIKSMSTKAKSVPFYLS